MAAGRTPSRASREMLEITSTFDLEDKPPVTPYDYIYTQRADEVGDEVAHPRRRSVMLRPSQLQFPEAVYGPMARWFADNVAGPLQDRTLWPETGHVLPGSLLLAWGPQGMGRATYTAQFCKKHRIQFIFVTSYVQSNTRFAHAMQLATAAATEGKPALLYFDNADWIVRNIECLSAFVGCFEAEIAHAPFRRPWVVLSFSSVIDDVHPMLRTLVRLHGAAVPVLPSPEREVAKGFIRSLLSQLSGDRAFPPATSEWTVTLERLAGYACRCTVAEIYEGLQAAFRDHHRELQRQGKPASAPFPAVFEKAAKQLPWLDAVHTFCHGNCVQRLESARKVWESYERMTGHAATVSVEATCPTTPSYYDSDLAREPTPSSLPSSPACSPASPAYEPAGAHSSFYGHTEPDYGSYQNDGSAPYSPSITYGTPPRSPIEKRPRPEPSYSHSKASRGHQRPIFTSWKI